MVYPVKWKLTCCAYLGYYWVKKVETAGSEASHSKPETSTGSLDDATISPVLVE